MSKSPHPVVCPKQSIQTVEVDCATAHVAVTKYLTDNPATITKITLGGLNHVNNCSCPECVTLKQQVNARFSRAFAGE